MRCRSDGRVKAAALALESNFANSVARVSSLDFRLAILPFFWAEVDAVLGLDTVVAEVESDRLNATERLLVLLVVDEVSFVISCCKVSNQKD